MIQRLMVGQKIEGFGQEAAIGLQTESFLHKSYGVLLMQPVYNLKFLTTSLSSIVIKCNELWVLRDYSIYSAAT